MSSTKSQTAKHVRYKSCLSSAYLRWYPGRGLQHDLYSTSTISRVPISSSRYCGTFFRSLIFEIRVDRDGHFAMAASILASTNTSVHHPECSKAYGSLQIPSFLGWTIDRIYGFFCAVHPLRNTLATGDWPLTHLHHPGRAEHLNETCWLCTNVPKFS